MKLKLFAFIWILWGGTAYAETRRIAVVVGNNAGHGENPPLHYAEGDAGKLSQTLAELGGVDASDLYLLQGRSLVSLREVFDQTKKKILVWHRMPDMRVVLLFYFSGHSDGEALELGRDRLTFSELRQWLVSTGAELRVAIVDSCKSGALLGAKGGKPGPSFQIRLNDDLASNGEALLTSSAADELALESREIRGSFFTHHLVSGLRGAADSSGDGSVTLAEAYQYAFSHTVSATAGTLIGPQHPAYDYRLSGQGELVLSAFSKPTASLELPQGFDRILVTQLLRDQVLAELPSGAAIRLAVPPGEYAVRAWRSGKTFAGRVDVRLGEVHVVRREDLVASLSSVATSKGAAATPAPASPSPAQEATVAVAKKPEYRGPALFFAPGVQRGVASEVAALGSLRLGVRSAKPSGWSVAVDLSSGRGATFWETSALVFGGYRFGFERGRFRGFAGLEGGVGFVSQNLDAGSPRRSATVAGAPWIGASLRLAGRISLALEGHVPVGWIRQDGKDVVVVLPAGWLGLLVRL